MGRRLVWHFYLAFLPVALLALAAAGWFSYSTLRDTYLAQKNADLFTMTRLLQEEFIAGLTGGDSGSLQAACRAIGARSGVRLTVIDPEGKVLADSNEDPARMANHIDRVEIRAALARGEGTAMRPSPTLHEPMLYAAVRLSAPDGRTLGVLRLSLHGAEIDRALRLIRMQVVGGGLLIAVVLGLVSFVIAERLSRPLTEMTRVATHFAAGDLHFRLSEPGVKELSELARAMNRMAEQLDERIRLIIDQRRELEAVLAGMVEGVVAVDREDRILRLNAAAGRLLGVDPGVARGRSIQAAVRNPDLQRFVARALESEAPVETEIALRRDEEMTLQAYGAPLRDAQGARIGALLVLHDVTRLRRLETVRRDFVANVSHELKTPVTAIKGFVETLIEGAHREEKDRLRFLGIIEQQAERLQSIIEDLLSLSKIEQDAGEERIPLATVPLAPILDAARSMCEPKAREKNLAIALACDERLRVQANSSLLEQAVVNLVDNAIKYSDPGKRIEIRAAAGERTISIEVRDQGCGIAAEHLPRLFERFYRVDKSRSRSLGGTGLGLSIVKHIVKAHQGNVAVESEPGKGSTFVIELPLEKNA